MKLSSILGLPLQATQNAHCLKGLKQKLPTNFPASFFIVILLCPIVKHYRM